MAGIQQLLFVDANIWLDFYRPRQSDVALELLRRLEKIKDKIIVTHILEMEYKSNRQAAIIEGLKLLNSPQMPPTLGIFSEAQASKSIEKHRDAISKKINALKKRLQRALTDPQQHDPVYKTFQRILARDDKRLIFSINSDRRLKRVIHEKAMRRFVLGCPPRKADDTSIGDAINWEWMVRCAEKQQAELVILTRDNDYGQQFDKHVLLNDHLNQEFKERVSQKRKVLVYRLASVALKHFHVDVPEKVAKSEEAFASITATARIKRRRRRVVLRDFLREMAEEEVARRHATEEALGWLDPDEPTGVAGPEEFEDLSDLDLDAGEDKGR